MPDIIITKQLNRPDGGKITGGSIATSNVQFDEDNKTVKFPLYLFITQTAKDDGKDVVPACVEFSNRSPSKSIPLLTMRKECTDAEWEAVNVDANAGALTTQWMQDCIDEIIGDGFTNQVT